MKKGKALKCRFKVQIWTWSFNPLKNPVCGLLFNIALQFADL